MTRVIRYLQSLPRRVYLGWFLARTFSPLMFLAGFTADERILDLRWPLEVGMRFEPVDKPHRRP